MLVTVAAYPLAVERLRIGSRDQAFAQITSNGLIMLGLVLPAAAGLFLLQGPLIRLLVAEPFRAMTLAVLPAALAAGLFRNVRTHVVDQVFILVERTRMVCAMTILEALLAIVGCVIGLQVDGAPGATVGSGDRLWRGARRVLRDRAGPRRSSRTVARGGFDRRRGRSHGARAQARARQPPARPRARGNSRQSLSRRDRLFRRRRRALSGYPTPRAIALAPHPCGIA